MSALLRDQVPRLQLRLETYVVRFEAAAALADACCVLDAHAAAIRCRSLHASDCRSRTDRRFISDCRTAVST